LEIKFRACVDVAEKKTARREVKPWLSNACPVTDTKDKENASSMHFKKMEFLE
jgi:hypothetical protein